MSVHISETELSQYVAEIWQVTLDMQSPVQIPELPEGSNEHATVTGIVHLLGRWSGSISVSISLPLAEFAAKKMFQGTEQVTQEDLISMVTEIANMAGGSIKGMSGSRSTLSPPDTLSSQGYKLELIETAIVAELFFECAFEDKIGYFSVQAHEAPLWDMMDISHLLDNTCE